MDRKSRERRGREGNRVSRWRRWGLRCRAPRVRAIHPCTLTHSGTGRVLSWMAHRNTFPKAHTWMLSKWRTITHSTKCSACRRLSCLLKSESLAGHLAGQEDILPQHSRNNRQKGNTPEYRETELFLTSQGMPRTVNRPRAGERQNSPPPPSPPRPTPDQYPGGNSSAHTFQMVRK